MKWRKWKWRMWKKWRKWKKWTLHWRMRFAKTSSKHLGLLWVQNPSIETPIFFVSLLGQFSGRPMGAVSVYCRRLLQQRLQPLPPRRSRCLPTTVSIDAATIDWTQRPHFFQSHPHSHCCSRNCFQFHWTTVARWIEYEHPHVAHWRKVQVRVYTASKYVWCELTLVQVHGRFVWICHLDIQQHWVVKRCQN